jgi:hypothetical protein
MFEKFTNKIVRNITQTAKGEIASSFDKQIPFIFGVVVIGVTLLSLMDTKKIEKSQASTIVINNYYFN